MTVLLVFVVVVLFFVLGFIFGIVCHPDNQKIIDRVKADIHPIGRVVDQGGGYVSVFVDRDLMNYPENGTRVFVGERAS